MKLDEFMAALSESEHEWVVHGDGEIRDERTLCPICSLAADRGWVVPGRANAFYRDAAESIGLSDGLAGLVASAADHRVSLSGGAESLPPGFPSAIVRVRLEKALEPKASGA